MPKTKTKDEALASLQAAQDALDGVTAQAMKLASIRDAAMYRAQSDHGATYADLQDATGLSPARVTQVLRRNRPPVKK